MTFIDEKLKEFDMSIENNNFDHLKENYFLANHTALKAFLRQSLEQQKLAIVEELKGKAQEMDFGGYVKAVLLDDILAVLPDKKIYILNKDCPNIGKEIGDYYNGEYAESIEELLAKEIIKQI